MCVITPYERHVTADLIQPSHKQDIETRYNITELDPLFCMINSI